MNKIIKASARFLSAALLTSCGMNPAANGNDKGNAENNAKGGQNQEERNISESVMMRAVIRDIGEKIEVEVTESEYTFGIHWVITHDATAFYGKDGSVISRGDLNVGDNVEILYSGQVMLSYPPQIVAHRITVL